MFDILAIASFFKNLIPRKSEKSVNNIEISKITNDSGTITIQNNHFTESAKMPIEFDQVYKCYFYKGDRVCAVCLPKVSKLKSRSVGGMPFFFCDSCHKGYYKEN